jgi:hypothetical protein
VEEENRQPLLGYSKVNCGPVNSFPGQPNHVTAVTHDCNNRRTVRSGVLYAVLPEAVLGTETDASG